MSLQNSSSDPFSTFEERSASTPDSDIETGAGGSDLAPWSDDRRERLLALITTTYDNQSSYTMQAGVVDTPARSFANGFQAGNGENPHETPISNVEVGVGGHDMLPWLYDRREQIAALITTTYTDESSYSLPTGVVDVPARSFDNGFQAGNGEKPHEAPSAGMESGPGGSEMNLWEYDRVDTLKAVAGADYTNQSSYPIPLGVVDVPARSFSIGFQAENGEVSHFDPDDHNVGEGVYLGRSVFDVTLSGEILAAPDPEEPVDPITVNNATITLEAQGVNPVEVQSGDLGGSYALAVPAVNTEYTVTASHPHLGAISGEIIITEVDADLDFILSLPTLADLGGGLEVGGGVRVMKL